MEDYWYVIIFKFLICTIYSSPFIASKQIFLGVILERNYLVDLLISQAGGWSVMVDILELYEELLAIFIESK